MGALGVGFKARNTYTAGVLRKNRLPLKTIGGRRAHKNCSCIFSVPSIPGGQAYRDIFTARFQRQSILLKDLSSHPIKAYRLLWRTALILWLGLGLGLVQNPVLAASEWYLEKRIALDTAARLAGDKSLTSQVAQLALKAQYHAESISLHLDGQWQYDSVYQWHSRYSDQAQDQYQQRFWLDEAFIEWRLGNYDLALGYQKVVWGQADDLEITDVVNPLDLKDFVFFDRDQYRISLPMLRLETSLKHWQLQGLWILDTQPNQQPPPGSEFSLESAAFPEAETDRTELGVKAEGFIGGSDLSLYGFYGYADNPIIDLSSGPRLVYHQETLLGFSLARPLNRWVLRSEWAWFWGRSFNTDQYARVERDVVQGLLAADYLYRDWLFTVQATDRWIQHWRRDLNADRRAPLYTLAADSTLLSGQANVRLAITHSEDSGQGQLYQIKTRYRPDTHWEFAANLDVLAGDKDHFFGQFADRDRLWLAATYLF